MALVNVIKYSGGPNIFAWKYPDDELTTKTQLIVSESQEAILFKGGQALDVFGPGSHTLETKNIPILRKLVNLPFGGVSPFKAEVWYVNKVHSLDIKWGTIKPVSLFDPFLMIDVKVKSFGQFGIRVNNSKKFIEKLVGTLPVFNTENITSYFRGEYLKKCTSIIGSYFTQKNVGILQVNTFLDDLSDYIKDCMTPFMDDYGISLINFSINSINADENDSSYVQIKQAMADRAKKRMETDSKAFDIRETGFAKGDVMRNQGYTYQQQRSFDVMQAAAENEGGGQNDFMQMGMGLAMGGKMGAVVGTNMGNMAAVMDVTPENTRQCSKCNAQISQNQKFCSNCGADTSVNINTLKCSNCGKELSEGTKFCPECGSPQRHKCPNCNIDIAPNSKFCPECGTKI